MANKNRKPGFYWVRYKEWIIAEWDGTYWTVTHNCANYNDNDWDEINERALAEPTNENGASSIPDVRLSLPDRDNYHYLRGFTDGYGGEEPHDCFPDGFKNINEVMNRMWELRGNEA